MPPKRNRLMMNTLKIYCICFIKVLNSTTTNNNNTSSEIW